MTGTWKTAACGGALTLALTAACGGGGSSPTTPTGTGTPATTTPTPAPTTGDATITITSAGVSPVALTVAPGTRVTFVNNDSRSHDMSSDPHPDHTNCPEINQAGFLNPGQSRQTGNLNTVRTCGFHDHDRPTDARLQGTITIR